MTDRYAHIREALEKGAFDFGEECCGRGEWNGNTSEPPECCGRPLTYADTIRALLAERDALIHDNAEYVRAANELAAENERLRAELEIERLKLAAIGAVAHGSEQRLDQDSPYRSDAYDTVCRLAEMAHDELAKDAERGRARCQEIDHAD